MREVSLHSLLCIVPDDWNRTDELVLRPIIDASLQPPLRKQVIMGETWRLNKKYRFNDTFGLRLMDLDNNYIDRLLPFLDTSSPDYLGQLNIVNTTPSIATVDFRGSGSFYRLFYNVVDVFELSASVGQGGVNQPSDVRALKQRLHGLGYNWLAINDEMDLDIVEAIKLFQSIIRGRQTVHGDGRVDVPGPTYAWLRASNSPRWQLMPAGSADLGYVNYELVQTNDRHDYGTNWLAETVVAAGHHYRINYLDQHAGAALITLNDMSLPQGGDTPDHAGHETGLSCDLRLPRTDGMSGGVTWQHPNYDRSATRAMLQSIQSQPLWKRTLFNDPSLIAQNLCQAVSGHDNHIHFEIKVPEREDQ